MAPRAAIASFVGGRQASGTAFGCAGRRLSASAWPHAVQEQFDGGLSPLFLILWTGDDAVVFVVPQHKAEEQVGRNGGIVNLDLAAVGKMLKQDCDGPNPSLPTLFMREFCKFRELDGLRRQGSAQHDHLSYPRVGQQV